VEAVRELRYGYRDEDAEVELVTMRVSVWGPRPSLSPHAAAGDHDAAAGRISLVLDGDPVEATLLQGEPAPGQDLRGPAVVALPEATLLLRAGWCGSVDSHGTITLTYGRAG
jgi:N-methylhydantoinase A